MTDPGAPPATDTEALLTQAAHYATWSNGEARLITMLAAALRSQQAQIAAQALELAELRADAARWLGYARDLEMLVSDGTMPVSVSECCASIRAALAGRHE